VAFEDLLANAATATAIASSAFIIFMAPHAAMSGPRRVLGGHAVGLTVGMAAYLLTQNVFTTVIATDLTAAAAVGLSMLVMAGTDTEHPPAAGTVLSLVLADEVVDPALAIIVAAVALTLARQFFRRWMIDLAH
jgi:CBS-domain-containing membrane protein